jgi:hypothetical protein
MIGCAEKMQNYSILTPDAFATLSCVAVVPFANESFNPMAGFVIAQAVSEKLAETGKFNVCSSREIERIFVDFGYKGGFKLKESLLLKASKKFKIDAVIYGKVTDFYSKQAIEIGLNPDTLLSYSMKMIRISDNRVLFEGSYVSSDDDFWMIQNMNMADVVSASLDVFFKDFYKFVQTKTTPPSAVCWKYGIPRAFKKAKQKQPVAAPLTQPEVLLPSEQPIAIPVEPELPAVAEISMPLNKVPIKLILASGDVKAAKNVAKSLILSGMNVVSIEPSASVEANSSIQYKPGYKKLASSISASLPVTPKYSEVQSLGDDTPIIITVGKDTL